MNQLPGLPAPPPDVHYALTVPQSVMFADLSLRGSRRDVFQRAFGTDYEPTFIAIDNGAMSWNFTLSDPFIDSLVGSFPTTPSIAAARFMEAMGRTSRYLLRKAEVLASPNRRRRDQASNDLLSDLSEFWDAYEAHMTSLFTFWNVETFVTDALIAALREEGDLQEIEAGLPTFIRPSEPNWFSLEQSNLMTLRQRFGIDPTPAAVAAAEEHVARFGFLLSPFNIGEPPTAAMVLERMQSLTSAAPARNSYEAIKGHSAEVSLLGELERQLSFWKTERLDAFALADEYMLPVYKEAAAYLGVDTGTVFRMTRAELTQALSGGSLDYSSVESRAGGFCLALINGAIDFYEPTDAVEAHEQEVAASGTVLRGAITSPGVVVGRVRLVKPGEAPTLRDDEVLVTQMTRPDMGAALDQAIAYVTDEGGRLSHAAIVSREKGKPCVTAVGNATRLLRPGMLIEVNGSEGTVTVLDASFLSEHP